MPTSNATPAIAVLVRFMRASSVAVLYRLLHYTPPHMRFTITAIAISVVISGSTASIVAQSEPTVDPVRLLVARLDLEKYKATIKGLTQFGDRRQGTDRNRAAVDWIEAQLKSYGCPTDRIKYEYQPTPPNPGGGRGRGGRGVPGGGVPRGIRTPTGVNTDPMK